MSRTNKDKPARLVYQQEPSLYACSYEHESGRRTKKRKEKDTEWHWMGSTPSWWNRLFHTRPRRNETHQFENLVEKTNPEDLEEMLEPKADNKPHKYYW